jgi:hypothetical protein
VAKHAVAAEYDGNLGGMSAHQAVLIPTWCPAESLSLAGKEPKGEISIWVEKHR